MSGSCRLVDACLTTSFNKNDNQVVTNALARNGLGLRRMCHFTGQRVGLKGYIC